MQTTIGENAVTALAFYPLTIKQGDSTQQQMQFSVSVPFDFEDVYKIMQDIMISQGENPLAVHFCFLAESAYDNDYFFDVIQLDEQTIIYSLQFDSKIEGQEPYFFNFAVRYDW